MELLKDYDVTILYHLGKANVVARALSRKSSSMGSLAHMHIDRRPLDMEIQILADGMVRLRVSDTGSILAHIEARSSLIDQILET